MRTINNAITILNENDAVESDYLFKINGESAMTVHAFKKHVLGIKNPSPKENTQDTRIMKDFFGSIGVVFWKKKHALENKHSKKCQLHYVKDLDALFGGMKQISA